MKQLALLPRALTPAVLICLNCGYRRGSSFYLLVELAGSLDEEYTITCELPSDKVGLLIGKRGEDVQRIRILTTVWQHCDLIN